MELYEQVVTDQDEIYTYFEVIRQLSPACILDVGMMLKRMGAVSRQAMHCVIPQNVRLDGVDFYPEVELPIYHGIYDHIYLDSCLPEDVYDLSVCLGAFHKELDGCLHKNVNESSSGNCVIQHWMSLKSNMEYLSVCSSAILFNAEIKMAVNYFDACCVCQMLQSGDRKFILARPKAV